MAEQPADWRGTPIRPGALVIYGAPVGRSIAMVEAIVTDPMLTPSGRIWLDVQRRAYGSWPREGDEPKRVHVGADRLTVVADLPPTTRLTEPERAERAPEENLRRAAWIERYHVEQAHGGITDDQRARCSACWAERRRFGEAWLAGIPLDETP